MRYKSSISRIPICSLLIFISQGLSLIHLSPLLFLFKKYSTKPQMMATPAKSPDTPPAIAPTLLRERLSVPPGGCALTASGTLEGSDVSEGSNDSETLNVLDSLDIEVSSVVDARLRADASVISMIELDAVGQLNSDSIIERTELMGETL
jgi:hypothetical protein